MSNMPLYVPGFVNKASADQAFDRLWQTLDWERREGAPRREYWQNDYRLAYTYGKAEGQRTYDAKPWDEFVDAQRNAINSRFGYKIDCCFINGYNDEKDSLGWHADDSPEMNPAQPVMSLSLGQERNIMVRDNESRVIETIRLGHGSLFIMPPRYQQTHQHKIPKGDRQGMGPRISLTYRGMLV